MTTQTIMWTILPNGIIDSTPGSRNLRLSLFVTPKLQPSVTPHTLALFPDFLDWPQTVNQMNFAVQFGSGASINAQRIGPTPDSELWQALLPSSTPVAGHIYPDYTSYAFRSFPVDEVHGFLKEQYQNIAANSPTKLPAVEDLLAADSFGAINFDFQRDREIARFINDILKDHQVIEAGELPATEFTSAELAFFQVAKFHQAHVPLQDPGDDESEPVPFAAPEIDFHQKVSSLGDYPELLRRLGLVIDLEVPFTADIPQGENSSLVQVAVEPVGENDERPLTRYVLDDTRFAAASRTSHPDIENGWLDLGSDQYQVIQVDVDGGALKAMNFAKSLRRANSEELKTDSTPESAGVPTLRTGGLSIVESGRAGQVLRDVRQTGTHIETLNTSPVPPTLFAEDLVRGYRIDVWDDRSNSWHSLCQRRGSYSFLASGQTISIDDEGYISLGLTEAADGSDSDHFYLHEKMFGWNGWCLSAPRVELTIGHQPGEGDTIEDLDGNAGAADLGLETGFTVIPGSLPRLRFGYTYRLRARTVDLAGNSLSFDSREESTATIPQDYTRFEPLSPPAVILRQTTDDSPGESVRRLVVRSNFDTDAQSDSQRHIVPPRTTQMMAELHGMFDGDGVLDKEAYTTIINKEALLPDEPVATLTELPYLPDPICRGTSFFGLPGQEDEVMQIPFEPTASWPDLTPFRIRLIEGADAPSMADGVLTVQLEKAEIIKVQLSSYLDGSDLEQLGIWRWLGERVGNNPSVAFQMEQAALLGRHWMITPYEEITVVHAVQQPLQAPETIDLSSSKDLGATHAELDGEIAVHGKSSHKLDVLADWQEWVDRLEEAGPRQVSGHTHVFEFFVGPEEDEISLTPPHGSPNNYRHDFGDTKYRAVDYSCLATTRFQEYFPEDTAPITRASEEPTRLDVMNSARPLAPKVLYVLPTFGWEDQGDEVDERFGRTRHGGGLRVYLERPWFSSGDGELLGALVGPARVPQRLKPYLTLWGIDPIWGSSVGIRPDSPRLDDFSDAVHIGQSLSLDEPANDSDQTLVDVAGHTVHYDEERQLWYCDIEIDSGNAYYPFVRLALARYQPNSLAGTHLSRVVLADFAQLAPDRTVSVLRDPQDSHQLTVTVSGPGYAGTHLGAQNNEIEVVVERKIPEVDDPILGWVPMAITTTELVKTGMTLDGTNIWSGNITLPQLPDSPELRLLIREYERFEVDGVPTLTPDLPIGEEPTSELIFETSRRLVFADTMNIGEV